MNEGNSFFDTNVLLYLLSSDVSKASRAEEALVPGGVISVQVLNEFTSVASRKFAMSLKEVREVLDVVRSVCAIESLTIATYDRGLEVAERYGFSVFDSMIIASALIADCPLLLSEDLQHGQMIEGRLRVINPFVTNT
jgi:predicted nucleic acid-binding protein